MLGLRNKQPKIAIKKRLFQGAFFLLLVFVWIQNQQSEGLHITNSNTLKTLFKNKQSSVMILFNGTVVKVLSDDNEGSRHQRFIVKSDDHTVLIAHNIDLAPRVPIQEGERIKIYGQYEWNEKGGVVHWTHHDPQNKHENGWIELNGKKFK